MNRSLRSIKMFAVMLLLAVGFGFGFGVTDHCSLITDVFAGSKQINFQGKLTDNNGAIVPDGLKAMKFHLYPAIDATTDEWNENVNVYVSSGLFNVTLGKVNSLDGVAFNKQYWLGIDVNSVELLPRQELAASAYALGSLGDFNINGKIVSNGNIGIGTNPNTDLTVKGTNYGISVLPTTGETTYNTLYICNNSANKIIGSNIKTKYGSWVIPDTSYPSSWIDFSGPTSSFLGDIYFNSRPAEDTGLGSTKMAILNNGNIGIGTTNPQAKLDVNGTFAINGQLQTNSQVLTMNITSEWNNLIPISNGQIAVIYWFGPMTYRGASLFTYDGTTLTDDRLFTDPGGAYFRFYNGYIQASSNVYRAGSKFIIVKY